MQDMSQHPQPATPPVASPPPALEDGRQPWVTPTFARLPLRAALSQLIGSHIDSTTSFS